MHLVCLAPVKCVTLSLREFHGVNFFGFSSPSEMNFGDVVDYVDLLRFLTWVLGKLHNQASSLDIFALTANLFSRLLQNRLHNFGRESEVFIHQFVEQRFYLLNQIPLFR